MHKQSQIHNDCISDWDLGKQSLTIWMSRPGGVLIYLKMVEVESFDFDSFNKDISTVKKVSTVWKRTSWQARNSQQFKNNISTSLKKTYAL